METIEIDLRGKDSTLTVYIDVADNSLSRKWLTALNDIIANNLHLEKNYCWLGWTESARNAEYLCTQINRSIQAINSSALDYRIADFFSPANVIQRDLDINHAKMNQLHRYFEDLQGTAGAMSSHYTQADDDTRWHIRQLNLLCHELESLVLSMRKAVQAPEWRRPSQLMCWLQAPRFELEAEDYDLFGIDTINRSMGGVYVGVNKAVGKHHWEVFCDEGRDSRVSELVTDTMRSQTEASGDFDIEWANNPGSFPWQQIRLQQFRQWLVDNGFDPEDRSLTIGHPQVGQVDLAASFGSDKYQDIWPVVSSHLDVWSIRTSAAYCEFDYHWSDSNFVSAQIQRIQQGN